MRFNARLAWPAAAAACAALAAGFAFTQTSSAAVKPAAAAVPTPAHVVVVMEENHSFSDIIGNTSQAPYFNSLASQGALMTDYFAITHPSDVKASWPTYSKLA